MYGTAMISVSISVCAALSTIDNGQWGNPVCRDGPVPVGTTCMVTCDDNHAVYDGQDTVTCEGANTYIPSGVSPECKPRTVYYYCPSDLTLLLLSS